jgi:addiction module RelE/StbE family toxin
MQIRWSDAAISDLAKIRRYIANDKPIAARNVAVRIKKTVNALNEHPALGRHGRIEGTRELVVSGLPYIIPYRVKNGIIEILRVFHTAMEQKSER